MKPDPRALMGARNNADLYEAMFTAWGLRFARLPYAFVGKDVPPPYYSNLTVLSEGHADDVMNELRCSAKRQDGHIGFKDSFCEFDARDERFLSILSGSWLWRKPQASRAPQNWFLVDTLDDLHQWEASWQRTSPTAKRMFPETLLSTAGMHFLARIDRDTISAGCIANESRDCVGISNFFSCVSNVGFGEAASAASALIPSLPLVGYLRDGLEATAEEADFEVVGKLRVLLANADAL